MSMMTTKVNINHAGYRRQGVAQGVGDA